MQVGVLSFWPISPRPAQPSSVGAGAPAKQATRCTAPASPVFAVRRLDLPAPTTPTLSAQYPAAKIFPSHSRDFPASTLRQDFGSGHSWPRAERCQRTVLRISGLPPSHHLR
ncbi:hypothetical protein CXG50_27580 [Pseudomonas plecoglossicida]|uniref:Uncharacterized protein n=1 Tax=Pseudomonas plecoglossicida TaxID=70775 RepID=A0ABX4TUS5_PSEDL|nr:hypothetical protein CSW00_28960 [Pseudomonas sp. MR 02]PLP88002.1 hypothetical protein CX682_22790 [Pseudomonas sp. FFUP_PS_41]PLU84114.1 hypothetical protein CXG44_28005 [Pseudomonas plecoglossicida]QKK98509.1 hypothetical protein GEV38_22200 [Pseudomonas sp. 13159349]TXI07998.1 MAG: hypothetical protein E6Q70_03690 [Pseudomonas monteilii]